MAKQLLIDRVGDAPVRLTLTEAAGGKIVARGEFARAGVATENKRVYPRALWERELASLRQSIEQRKVFGELDHPNDGRTKLTRVSHLITSLELEGDVIMGESEILNTDQGRNLKAILAGGGSVGVSSRGYGTTAPGPDGQEIVQEDYKLMTFDFVAEPADSTAYPKVYSENKDPKPQPVLVAAAANQEKDDMDLTKLTAEELKKANPNLVESLVAEGRKAAEDKIAELKASMKKELGEALPDIKRKAFEEAKAQVLSDPELAGARIALEQIQKALGMVAMPEETKKVVEGKDKEIDGFKTKIAEADLRVKGLEDQLTRLCDVAREAAYKYHLEARLVGSPKPELVRKMVGDVRQYESVKAIDSKVEAINAEVQKHIQSESRIDADKKALIEENAKLKKSTENALQVARDMAVTLYVERKVKGHPQAKRLQALIEAKQPTNKAQVDLAYESVVGQFTRSDDEVERIRRRLGRARESLINESVSAGGVPAKPQGNQGDPLTEDLKIIGGDMDEIRELSGMK